MTLNHLALARGEVCTLPVGELCRSAGNLNISENRDPLLAYASSLELPPLSSLSATSTSECRVW